MHPHLPRDVAKDEVAIFKFHPEGRIGEILENLTLHLDVVFPRHDFT